MKRSFQLIVSLVVVSAPLAAVAGCPCARQKKQMRAKAASGQVAAQPMRMAPAPVQMAPAPAPAPVQMAPAPAPAPMKMAPAPAPQPMKMAPAPMAPTTMEGNSVTISSEADFNAQISNNPNVVAIFSTTWCGPCKELKKNVLPQLLSKNKHVVFLHVDGDNIPRLSSKYVKIGYPTLKFFKNGKEVGQALGGSEGELQNLINSYLK